MNLSVLIVEDSRPMCRIIIRLLADLGITDVDACIERRTALSRASGRDYDLVIIDYFLGDCTGVEVIRDMRATGAHVPAVLITGRPSQAREDLGSDVDWLIKPFSAQELAERIALACPHWQAGRP